MKNLHANNFDALRLLAALTVFHSHMFALMGQPEPVFISGYTYGAMALLVFFTISGYLITQSWQADPTPYRFLARRFLRIWPGMFMVVAATMLVFAPLAVGWEQLLGLREYTRYPLNLLPLLKHPLLQLFPAPHTDINNSIWTIPYEIWCYLMLMIAGMVALLAARILPRFHRAFSLPVLVPAALVVSVLFFQFHLGGQAYVEQQTWLPRLFHLLKFAMVFAMGALLRLYPILHGRCGAVLVVVGLPLLMMGQTTLGLLLTVPVLVIAIGTHSWPLLSKAGAKGDFSYGTYLYAFPIQQLAVMYFGIQAAFPLVYGVALVFTLVCGWLSWHLVEAPALRLKPRASKPC